MASPDVTTTSLLLSNLHCPSCVSKIEDSLYSLIPKPLLVSASIITSLVTIQHNPSLQINTVTKTLNDAGFEICSITLAWDTKPTLPQISSYNPLDSYLNASHRSRPPQSSCKDAEEMHTRHLKDCDLCQEEAATAGTALERITTLSSQLSYKKNVSNQDLNDEESENLTSLSGVTILGNSPVQDHWRAELAVGGMTCASCATSIREELEKLDWIEKVAVNLISNSASVDFFGETHKNDLVPVIENIGFEAVLDNVIDLSPSTTQKRWRAELAIGGMTCASCANAIREELGKLDWIEKVSVNLIGNSATVDFSGEAHKNELVPAIEDLGFEAVLDNIIDLSATTIIVKRTVEVRVAGMFCKHCPGRIMEALKPLEGKVQVEHVPTVTNPILKLSYTPVIPTLTIRYIMDLLSKIDERFTVSIYHPPTLEERSQHMHAAERRRILARVCLAILSAIPTFIIGIVFMSLVPSSNPVRVYLSEMWTAGVSRAQWCLFILSTPVYFFAADVFHRRALREVYSLWKVGSKTPIHQRFYRFGSMNMLMSLGTSIAYISSVGQLIAAATHPSIMVSDGSFYFDSVVFLTMFLLIGRLIEAYSKSKTGDAVSMLGKLRPTEAILLENETTSTINVDLLEVGDSVRILHGASPPSDGILTHGSTIFDESSLTGESKPVKKAANDIAFSGTVNKGSPIVMKITGTAGASLLDQIVKAVREGQTRRAPIERIADTLTSVFVPFITLIAITTWVVWLILGLSGALPRDYLDTDGSWATWSLQFAIAVFVVACPCGLALAAPTALFVGGGLAAKYGILVKGGGEAFEKASRLDCIVFDKTGTLTVGGEPVVTEFEMVDEDGVDETAKLLGILQLVEERSGHPIAKAIVSYCKSRGARAQGDLLDTEEIPGKGMKAAHKFTTKLDIERNNKVVTGILVGNESLLADHDVRIAPETNRILSLWQRQGKSVALVARQISPSAPWSLSAILAISDPLRPESTALIHALQKRNIDVWMLSGDNATTANAVGSQLNILSSNIIAGVLPSQKADKIRYLQQTLTSKANPTKRAVVAMVGDGINDAPALTTADIGIAIGSGSDIAISSASFVLISPSLMSLLTLLDLSRTVFKRIKFNFCWALVYNMCALPVAAGALYPVRTGGGGHVRLDPVWASLAMALSSISVVCCSLALRSNIPGLGFRARTLEGRNGKNL